MCAGRVGAQWWAMRSASDIRRWVGRLILVIFMVVHAPVSGVMTAAQAAAHGDPAGAGTMVICVGGSFEEVRVPGGADPGSTASHECLCPCATLGAESVLVFTPSAWLEAFQATDLGQAEWAAHPGPSLAPPPQSGRGSPRSPPFSFI